MVSRVTHNPFLKGCREWNRRISKRENRTGKRRSVKAPPEELLTRECKHLAFIEPARYDRILRKLDVRNEGYRRGKQLAKDQRQGVPRSRTVWPGQSVECGVCGRMLYYGAHGQNDRLLCSGAIDYRCWNGASASGPDAARRICESVLELIQNLSEFDDALIDEVREEVDRLNKSSDERVGQVGRELQRIEREIGNVVEYIRSGTKSQSVTSELEQLEGKQANLHEELAELSNSQAKAVELPPASEVRSRGLKLFSDCAKETPEFGRLMNRFVEDLVVDPVQLIDGGKVGLRATFAVNLLHLVEEGSLASRLDVESMRIERTVDLLEVPQRVAHLAEVVRLSKLNGEVGRDLTEREIAEKLGITQPAVQYAKRLYREMKQRGLDDPYQVLSEPPVMGKLRRHLHSRYRFEPLKSA